MSNDIEKLRAHLFGTLDALRDKENPMDIDRAKAVCEVGDVIISTAKAEIDFARVNGSVDSQFFHKPVPGIAQISQKPEIPLNQDKPASATKNTATGTLTVVGNTTTHKMK